MTALCDTTLYYMPNQSDLMHWIGNGVLAWYVHIFHPADQWDNNGPRMITPSYQMLPNYSSWFVSYLLRLIPTLSRSAEYSSTIDMFDGSVRLVHNSYQRCTVFDCVHLQPVITRALATQSPTLSINWFIEHQTNKWLPLSLPSGRVPWIPTKCNRDRSRTKWYQFILHRAGSEISLVMKSNFSIPVRWLIILFVLLRIWLKYFIPLLIHWQFL